MFLELNVFDIGMADPLISRYCSPARNLPFGVGDTNCVTLQNHLLIIFILQFS